MARTPKKTAIPGIPRDVDPEMARFLTAVKEALEAYQGRGDALDKAVTLRDLQNTGMDVDMVENSSVGYDFDSLL